MRLVFAAPHGPLARARNLTPSHSTILLVVFHFTQYDSGLTNLAMLLISIDAALAALRNSIEYRGSRQNAAFFVWGNQPAAIPFAAASKRSMRNAASDFLARRAG
ncbi:MAG: hypothetical protein DMG44_11365 [Acidobacteria bacterium]|nr:MAG: hypothetical protein DMG44_11365 [Acidobacteriota bacterium]